MPDANRKTRRATTARKRKLVPAGTESQLEATAIDLTPEQVIPVLQAQVSVTREAFFKLAQARAADRVRFGEFDWDQGANYINAEMQGLDQQLQQAVAQNVPPQGEQATG